MTQAPQTTKHTADRIDRFVEWLRSDFGDGLATLATGYPSDRKSLEIEFDDLRDWDEDISLDLLDHPQVIIPELEEALRIVDLPVDISLEEAHVRVGGLPEPYSFYPGTFSPSEQNGRFRGIRGEIEKATGREAVGEVLAFECLRCGTYTRVAQDPGTIQEPYECNGCERKGPWDLDDDESQFVDAQRVRIKTPPDAMQGAGETVDAILEDDIAGTVQAGDRIELTGTLCLKTKPQDKGFELYLEVNHVHYEQADRVELEIDPEERQRVEELASGAEGDPLSVSAASLHERIHGYESVKKALILVAIGGDRVSYDSGTADRGDFHILLLGDPSTGKSELGDAISKVAPRSVDVDSSDATLAGLTTAAVQSDFGDGSWEIEAGAFVKANGGMLWIDEIDDMPPDVRKGLMAPMQSQQISPSKAGINATFSAQAAVVAAGNPAGQQFDPYEPIPNQFELEPALLSRFDLIFTFRDQPDEKEDSEIADTVLRSQHAQIRKDRGEEVAGKSAEFIDAVVDEELLTKWIDLARRQPPVTWESEEVLEFVKEKYVNLRGMYGFEADKPRAVTHRKLPGIRRICQAVAKLHLADSISMDHAKTAMELVGESMADYAKDEDGRYDADVIESGSSKSQHDRKKQLVETIRELSDEHPDSKGCPREDVVADLDQFEAERLQRDIDRLLDEGDAIEPEVGFIHWIGDWF